MKMTLTDLSAKACVEVGLSPRWCEALAPVLARLLAAQESPTPDETTQPTTTLTKAEAALVERTVGEVLRGEAPTDAVLTVVAHILARHAALSDKEKS